MPQCPLCFSVFPQSTLEAHASRCDGTPPTTTITTTSNISSSSSNSHQSKRRHRFWNTLIRTQCASCMNGGRSVWQFDASATCSAHTGQKFLRRTKKPVPLTDDVVGLCVVIKPSVGSFRTHDPISRPLFHVGLSSRDGTYVFHFNERGAQRSAVHKWKEALCVPLHPADHDVWDDRLKAHLANEKKRMQRYHGLKNNCYSFVIRFLNRITYQNRSNHTRNSVLTWLEKPIMETEHWVECHLKLQTTQAGYIVVQDGLERKNTNTSSSSSSSSRNVVYACDFCDTVLTPPIANYTCRSCKDFNLCQICYDTKREGKGHKVSHQIVQVLDM
jgi:hypothetical protein